jgi:hypothetical protein
MSEMPETPSTQPSFASRFWPVFGIGLLGVATLPLTFPPSLEERLRAAAPALSLGVLKSLTLIQPALLLLAGAAIGAAVAHRAGFCSHLAGINVRRRLIGECPLAIASGLITGFLIVSIDLMLLRGAALEAAPPSTRTIVEGLVGGVLYGGLTEEVMMRWGLMSLVAWAGLKLARRAPATRSPVIYAIAIVVVAVIFAAGHLPAASVIAPLDAALVIRILVLNGLAGIVYGGLFWRRSLEAVMTAHMATHVAFALARGVGWG